MARNKEQGKKEFLIAARKKVGPGLTNAPFWAMQKKGDRIWNKKGKRHWRSADLGKLFEKNQRKQERNK